MSESAPKTFISYAHYDRLANHRPRVFSLSEHLRSVGVDCHIDQYEENDPPSNWPRWMTEQIEDADFVLVLCTETYCRRFEGKEEEGSGLGSTWEGGAITSSIYNRGGGKHKFIPLTLGARSSQQSHIPFPLDGTSSYNIESEADLDRLLRRLHQAPEVKKGELGSRPDFSTIKPLERDLVADSHQESRHLISDPERHIQAQQFFRDLTRLATAKITQGGLSKGSPEPSIDAFRERVVFYEEAVEALAAALSELAYFGKKDQLEALTSSVKGIYSGQSGGGYSYNCWENLWQYPAMYCFYAAGVSAMHALNYDSLYALIFRIQVYNEFRSDIRHRLATRTNIPFIFQKPWAEWLEQPLQRAKYPGSEYMVRRLIKTLSPLISADEVEQAFDQFEHFLSLVLHDSDSKGTLCGRFCYKLEGSFGDRRINPITEPIIDGLDEGNDWRALKSGFFGGDVLRARTCFEEHLKDASKYRF